MPTLYLVRHGRAAASWDQDPNPGLDDLGHEQARQAAKTLARLGPLNLFVSPMVRTRETAAALAQLWNRVPCIEPRVSEIPSPTDDLEARGKWLREISASSWPELDESLRRWRAAMLETLLGIERDAVIVTHYVAINAAVGAATGSTRVVNFRPDYCSITILQRNRTGLELIQTGAEGETRVR